MMQGKSTGTFLGRSDRTREGEIVGKIINDLSRKDQEALKPYLLTVLCHGDVMTSSGDGDKTRVPAETGFNLRAEAAYGNTQSRRRSARLQSKSKKKPEESNTPAQESTMKIPISYAQKTHYHIVFQEVGTPLTAVESMSDAFHALRHVAAALAFLHKAGWVHRDVGAHNILWVGSARIGKLADLEYAKKGDDNTHHTVQTATHFFMAGEVRNRDYHYLDVLQTWEPPHFSAVDHPSQRSGESYYDQLREYRLSGKPTAERTTKNPQPFRCNPLHDVESVWWVALDLLFYRGMQGDDRSLHDRRVQQGIAAFIFEDMAEHGLTFHSGERLYRHVSHLHSSVLSAGVALEYIRKGLQDAYKQVEKLGPDGVVAIEPATLELLWTSVRQHLGTIVSLSDSLFLNEHQHLQLPSGTLDEYLRGMAARKLAEAAGENNITSGPTAGNSTTASIANHLGERLNVTNDPPSRPAKRARK
ncbi:hypothetical protein NM688_g2719 [Phlebia brevispora]|uniref:Uncharacterized protein n=1 Tax=Phlebia brevispora TaxID=194682 RepID=A0ACC1T7Q0_9APHY|nr:hypothetical protein NM688_g2719 [Phlebia brevispora]